MHNNVGNDMRILMIKTYCLFMILILILFCTSSVIYTQTDTSLMKNKIDTLITPDKRSEVIFRTLNDAGIKFKKIKEKAFDYVRQGSKSEATDICEVFVKEITDVRKSVAKIQYLSQNDLRYMDKSLNRMQEDIEQLINDIPFMQLISN